MIDLHVHSTFSDGSYTPEELAKLAAKASLTAIALTDHDSTEGLDRFLVACEKESVLGIPGIEISAEISEGTLHVLGYFVEYKDEGFQETLRQIRDGREIRNHKMIEQLNELGLELTWEEVASYAGEDVVGRPHFAQAMIARGYVKNKRKVFDKYLAKGKPGYADRFRLSVSDAISSIRAVGGVPVLAHPSTLRKETSELRDYIRELADLGMQGIEVYYSEHSEGQVMFYEGLAKEFGLTLVGGSDFHGDVNPRVSLGTGFGSLNVPDELVEALKAKRGK
jgi:predicted metal-dependent phosphoesterase TrpH